MDITVIIDADVIHTVQIALSEFLKPYKHFFFHCVFSQSNLILPLADLNPLTAPHCLG